MSVGGILTLGLGSFGDGLLLTLGYGGQGSPVVPTVESSTPGFAPHRRPFILPQKFEREIPDLPVVVETPEKPQIDRSREYIEKSAQLARQIAESRAQAERYRAEIAELEAAQALARNRQERRRLVAEAKAAQEAANAVAAQEAALLEQIEVLDVAFCALAVLTTIQ